MVHNLLYSWDKSSL